MRFPMQSLELVTFAQLWHLEEERLNLSISGELYENSDMEG